MTFAGLNCHIILNSNTTHTLVRGLGKEAVTCLEESFNYVTQGCQALGNLVWVTCGKLFCIYVRENGTQLYLCNVYFKVHVQVNSYNFQSSLEEFSIWNKNEVNEVRLAVYCMRDFKTFLHPVWMISTSFFRIEEKDSWPVCQVFPCKEINLLELEKVSM